MPAQIPEPIVMGVVNVTPDSFSDGGEWLEPDAAIAHGRELVAQGAASFELWTGVPAPVSVMRRALGLPV